MPTGMVVMHWDERIGVEILGAYPAEATIQEKTLMQIYSQHEFSGDAGLVSLSAGAVNLASYYTGPESAVYVILILTPEEDGDSYGEGMVEISRQILTSLDPEALKHILPPLFQRLSVYPTLNEEQKLAMLYNSEIKRMILGRLRDESLLPKSEIAIWLKDQYEKGFVDIDSIIASMVKNEVIKTASIKGLSSDVVFLNRDLMVLRIPPLNILKDPVDRHLPESLKEEYVLEVRNAFKDYKPIESDNAKIIDEVLLDPEVYETIKLMREAIVTRNDLEKLKKKGVENVDKVLKTLWENKMIAVFQDDKNTEYYCLISDFHVSKYYPRYNLDTIRKAYREKAKNSEALLEALDIMRDDYYAMVEAEKKAKDTKTKS